MEQNVLSLREISRRKNNMYDARLSDLVPFIMAGGTGTRFWPLSTADRPKQFLDLFGDRSLLRMSFDRLAGLVPPDRIFVLTSKDFVLEVRSQLPELPPQNVIGEPLRKDTGAAVALGAVLCARRFENAVMAVLTSDHLIEPVEEFHRAMHSAACAARESGALYTFGIEPDYPASAFGYLERGERVLDDAGVEHYRLLRFHEKPSTEMARSYLETGRFLWNSGMFVWTVDAILEEIGRQLPDHLTVLEGAVERDGKEDWDDSLRTAFESLEPVSIDYGVMENAVNVRCIRAPFSWEDVGGWLALEAHLEKDAEGNATRGAVWTLDARDNLVFCENPAEEVALLGVEGLVVVRAGRRTIVVPKDRAEDVKKLVRRILESGS